ncbi:MAG: LysE family transporter [Spirochaetales bacterium]|nr:LysE family transporter [Spirochaetales bacterium]
MNLLMIALASFGISLSGAVMPGPLLSKTIDLTVRKGFWQGPLLVVGHAIPEIIVVVALASGASTFLTNRIFTIVVAFVGAAVMLYMAVSMFFSLKKITIPRADDPQAGDVKIGSGNTILTGAIVSVSNPYFTIWWTSVGLGYIVSAMDSGVIGVIVFFIAHICGDLLWYSVISGLLSKGKNLFSDKVFKSMIFACATVIVIFAGMFILKGAELVLEGS